MTMWFWKRTELWLGYSMEEFNRLRRILDHNGIEYDYKIRDRIKMDPFGSERRINSMARMGEAPAYRKRYYLYVNKENDEYARHLISDSPKEQ